VGVGISGVEPSDTAITLSGTSRYYAVTVAQIVTYLRQFRFSQRCLMQTQILWDTTRFQLVNIYTDISEEITDLI
jgi:hypothetical protein